jgi:hypothetical protein
MAAPIGELIKEAVAKPGAFKHDEFVHMSFEGEMAQVGEFNAKLRREFEEQKVGGVDDNDRPFLVLHGNPDKTRTLKMDLGFSIRGKYEVKSPLKTSKLNFDKVARFIHRGDPRELSEVNKEFLKYAGKNADESVIILHLLSHSPKGNDDQIEMIVPLK